MRNQLIATAAAAALFAFTGAAQAETVGHVGVNYGNLNVDVGGFGDADANAYQLEGAVAFDAGALGLQFDGSVTNYDLDGGDSTVWTGTAHLNKKFDGGLVGGFAGLADDEGATLWAVGGEGQFNLGSAATFYGQVGYGEIDDTNVDFWAGRAELRYFVSDNFKLAGLAGYTAADAGGGDIDYWNIGAQAEYQFAGTPFSVWGGYEHGEFSDVDIDSDTFRIGVRFTFGGTLRDRDQAGASLGSAAGLAGGLL